MARSLGPERLSRLVGGFDRSPAYMGLRVALQELIGDGRIAIGTRLPSERAVAVALGLSRTTVTRAYSDLVEAGFATARQGSGTYTAAPLDRRRAHDRALQPYGHAQAPEGVLDLNIAAGAATPGVASAFERALTRLPAYLGGDGYLPSGLPELQAVIAEGYAHRGLATMPEQIVITSGAQSGTAIVARALTKSRDRIMVESPVYPNAVEALRLGGQRLVASPLADPLGDHGWDLEGVAATLQQTAPRLAYLIPDFQNPTGFLMNDATRKRYARALRLSRTTALIDETLQSTSITGEPMPSPFARYAPDAITLGSASKMFWGGLRVGWIRAPLEHVDRLVAARVTVDLGSSLFDQLVVTELLTNGEIVRRRREILRSRRDTLAEALREHLPTWRFRLPDGGLALWVKLPHGSATQTCAELAREGVYLPPGPIFSVEGGADGWLRIPYTRSEDELVSTVGRISDFWQHAAGAREGRGHARRVLIA